jgi:hypothetical protein
LIWEFCKAHRESLVDKAKNLQAEACEIVRQCFQVNEYRAFWEGTNVFTRHFRDAYKFQDPSYAVPQPPIVAVQQYQPAGGLGHQRFGPVPDMEVRGQGAQRQFELLSTSDPDQTADAAATIPFGTASNAGIPVHQGSGFMPGYGHNSRLNCDVAVNEDRGSAQQHHFDGQDVQYGCQSFAGLNGAERPLNQDASYSGVPFSNTYGDGQVQAIGTYEMGNQIWFDWDTFINPLCNPCVS